MDNSVVACTPIEPTAAASTQPATTLPSTIPSQNSREEEKARADAFYTLAETRNSRGCVFGPEHLFYTAYPGATFSSVACCCGEQIVVYIRPPGLLAVLLEANMCWRTTASSSGVIDSLVALCPACGLMTCIPERLLETKLG